MVRAGALIFTLFCSFLSFQQNLSWTGFVDSIPTLSSPRPVDLNNDGVLDLVFGGGTDGQSSIHGVMAFNGLTGSLLWELGARNEIFGSAVFEDINNDGIKDVFINGREAQFFAIDGASGSLLWDFFPYGSNPADSGYYNFYNPIFIDDFSGDGLPDLLVANGGDHSAPDWETNRPPGHLMILNAATGSVIAKAVVPDSAETYCSPVVVDLQNNGEKWILYGTGGENLGGSFWVCPLNDLLNNSLNNSIPVSSSSDKGYIAPASIFKTPTGSFDFIVQSYSGTVQRFNGLSLTEEWSFSIPNTESSAAPVIGNFTGGDVIPDVFVSLFKGVSPSYSDFYQVVLDGLTGNVAFFDSLGTMAYASGSAVDLNNDGRDEVVVLITDNSLGFFETALTCIDFQNNSISVLNGSSGVNLGCTPLIFDSNQDSICEIAYTVKRDSLNPVAWNGVYLNKIDLTASIPNSGIAWGGYMGSFSNGFYHSSSINCGQGSIITGAEIISPSCNHLEDGAIDPIVGPGNLTYIWSTSSVDSSLQNLGAGSYWVHITNDSGCFEERSVVLSDPYVVSYGGIFSPTCIGDTNGAAIVSSTGCPCQFSTCTFLWDNGVTTKPNNSLSAGWHYTTINYPDGCITFDSVFVPEPMPVIESFSYENPSCFGFADGSISIIADSAFAPHVFLWSNQDTSFSISGLAAGEYSCFVEDSRSCTDSAVFTIINPEEISFAYSVQNVLCFGEESGSISVDSILGGNGVYSFYINEAQSVLAVDSLSSGTYLLYVEDSLGCVSEVANVSISQAEPLSASYLVSPVSAENTMDGVVDVVVSGGTAPYSYSFNSAPGQSNSLMNNLSSGWCSIEITDSNNCLLLDSVFLGVSGLFEEINLVSVFPNPANDFVWVSLNSALFGRESGVIYDARGRQVKTLMFKSNTTKVDVSSLFPGVYFLRFQNSLTKFIIE